MDFALLIPILVTASGIYFLIKLKFFFIIHPLRTLKEFCNEIRNEKSRRSFFLALAGTLGVGNIFGVSAGILIGGPGSLFWMLISSIFAMVIKYAETLCTCAYPENKGGMAFVIAGAFKKRGRPLSLTYATLTVILAFFMGAAMQSGAIADVSQSALGMNKNICTIIVVFLFIPCLFGGLSKIEKVTEILIPLTTIVYILMCLTVILINNYKLPTVFESIINSAFSLKSFGSGVGAIAVKEGFARGILSNEAGVGTSALGHSTAKGRDPHIAGLFGIFEVFFDTSLLCMLTGLTILLSVPNVSQYKTPMALVSGAFSASLGDFSRYVLTLLTFSFAYSTIICWYFYGERLTSIYFVFLRRIYPMLFITFLSLSHLISSQFLLYVVDFLLTLMSCLTISAIVKEMNSSNISIEKSRGT